MSEQPWGRVDENNVVFVRDGADWREVGQYPDVSAEEALAYFERKFDDLASQVALLEARSKRGAPAKDIASAVRKLQVQVQSAHAVGDLASLAARLDVLAGSVTELSEAQKAEAEAAKQVAIAERTAIVEEIESLAATPIEKIQWKQASTQVDALFAKWQQHQKSAPQLPKSVADDLWKRFRAARSSLDAGRRAFFSSLDAQHKQGRSIKEKLVEKARALAPKGADGIGAYRSLLEEWKQAPRAGKKLDDALWAEFKTAGDVLYAAKAELDKVTDAEFSANLERKEALLAEAEPILSLTDVGEAKKALRKIAKQWDEIGKVPREAVRRVEDRMRAIEAHVRKLEEDNWRASDPEKKARAEGMLGQLTEAIAELQAELAEAEASGDAKRIAFVKESLAARQSWLDALSN